MKLQEFMQTVQRVVDKHAPEQLERDCLLSLTRGSSRKGIVCNLYLDSDGNISAEPTSIRLNFIIVPSAS